MGVFLGNIKTNQELYKNCFVIGWGECYTHLGRELNRKESIYSLLMVSPIIIVEM
jgi:hypothetical protein